MIKVKNLSVVFNRGEVLEARALADVSLAINKGEFVTVIGSNGAGKSTLLAAIAGDMRPNSGEIFIDDKNVTALPAAARARQVARVFQDPLAGTCAELSIEDNLALAHARGGRRGLRPAVGRARRELFCERLRPLGLGLENRLADLAGALSGGQRQALSLIMATLAPSRIFLLDEHTAALDPGMAAFVLDLTARLCEERQLTALMVTHSMQSALQLGGRTVMLHQGRVALDIGGSERARLRPPDLLRLFSAAVGGDAASQDRLALSAVAAA